MGKHQTKTFTAQNMKFDRDGAQGEFKCEFAALGVIDKDGDVLLPGILGSRLGDGTELKVRIASWGHKWQELPVGTGTIYESDGKLFCDGKFFIDTEHGLQTYKTVKGLGELAEWSFGFDILSEEPGVFDGRSVRFLKKVSVFEVSPVLQGAGIGTRTVDMKSQKNSMPSMLNDLAVRSAPWDAAAAEARVRAWAGGDENMDWAKYAQAFFHGAGGEDFGAYQLQYCDVVDDQLVAVPRGVFAAAATVAGSRPGAPDVQDEALDDLKEHIHRYYDAMSTTFEDNTLGVPWESGKACFLCGHEKDYPTCADCGIPETDCACIGSVDAAKSMAQTELINFETIRARTLGVDV